MRQARCWEDGSNLLDRSRSARRRSLPLTRTPGGRAWRCCRTCSRRGCRSASPCRRCARRSASNATNRCRARPYTSPPSGTPGTDASEISRFPHPRLVLNVPCILCGTQSFKSWFQKAMRSSHQSTPSAPIITMINGILPVYRDCERFRRLTSVNVSTLPTFRRKFIEKILEIEERHPVRSAALRWGRRHRMSRVRFADESQGQRLQGSQGTSGRVPSACTPGGRAWRSSRTRPRRGCRPASPRRRSARRPASNATNRGRAR